MATIRIPCANAALHLAHALQTSCPGDVLEVHSVEIKDLAQRSMERLGLNDLRIIVRCTDEVLSK